MTDLQNSLTLNDLGMVVNIIDACTERGSFKGSELVAVGTVRERFVVFIESHSAEATEVDGEMDHEVDGDGL
jgi:hypothetical protein